jgi:hypothetical protein
VSAGVESSPTINVTLTSDNLIGTIRQELSKYIGERAKNLSLCS